MKLIFLGTGAGTPCKNRNVTSMMLTFTKRKNEAWLFDCGEGTQHQLLKSGLKTNKISKIFITHLHGDHIFGLPGLLSSRALQTGTSPITVYGPKGLAQYLNTALTISESRINFELDIVEITSGIILDTEYINVEAGELDHRIMCMGYRITETDRPHMLNKNKLIKMGIIENDIHQRITRGENIILEDGRFLESKHFLSGTTKGKVLVIFGDTRTTKDALPLARRADVLIHEATYDAEKEDKAFVYGHSTTKQAAKFALQAQVKRLIITHFSSRYFSDAHLQQLLQESQSIFPNTELAKDFSQFDI